MVIFWIFIPCSVLILFLCYWECTASIFTLTEFGSGGWSERVEDNVSVKPLFPFLPMLLAKIHKRIPYKQHIFFPIQSLHHPNEGNSVNQKMNAVCSSELSQKKPSTPHGTEMHKITIAQTKQCWKWLDPKGYIPLS